METFKFWIEKKEDKTKGYGRFIFSPLPREFGHTFGNALRRVLLSHISGMAITRIKVKGANHPFALLKGVKEDLIEIILKIKQIRINCEKDKLIKLQLDKKGPGAVTAGDIKTPLGAEIVNPDLILANLADAKTELKIDFEAERGVGFSLASEHKAEKMRWIAVDAIFSPVVKANYFVKEVRIGKEKGMNKLTLEIWTDQTVSPLAVLKQAAQTLINGFSLITKPLKKETASGKEEKNSEDLSLYLEETDLPLRLVNALKKGGFKKLADFEGLKRNDLLKIKNVGEKSGNQLIKILKSREIKIEE